MTFSTCSEHRPLRESYEARFAFGISIKTCKINLTIAGKLCIPSKVHFLFLIFLVNTTSVKGIKFAQVKDHFILKNWISFHQRDDKIESLPKLRRKKLD